MSAVGQRALKSWATGDWSKSGKAHLWIESPFNARYCRSGCGLIATAESLQAPGEEIGKCKQCEKAEKRMNAASNRTAPDG